MGSVHPVGSAEDLTPPAQAGVDWGYAGSLIGSYWRLCKPRVVSLVVWTAAASSVVWLCSEAIRLDVPFSRILWNQLGPLLLVLLCIAGATAASGALNMALEGDIDALMPRTRRRPLPSGEITAGGGVIFGLILFVASVVVLGIAINWTSAVLLIFAGGIYVGLYTLILKRRVVSNIVIGGAAGALPPVVAWAALSGEVWDVRPWILFALIFAWTPPHFWALAILRGEEYRAVGVPMLPREKGLRRASLEMLAYTVLTVVVSWWGSFVGLGGRIYFAMTLIAGLLFVRAAVALCVLAFMGGESLSEGKMSTELVRACQKVFRGSILYLAVVMLALVVDRLVVAW